RVVVYWKPVSRHHPKITPLPCKMKSNMALNLAPFGRWTLRDKAAQRRLALRYTNGEINGNKHFLG
ncbi:MAG: hypothetical protein RI826_10575, partial [Chlorobium phaeovibrioides]|nr:hypothetical protein [Chlorobium phaeovibrioides]